MNKVYNLFKNHLIDSGNMRYVVFLILGIMAFSIVFGLFFLFDDLESQVSIAQTIIHFSKIAMSALFITLTVSVTSIGIALKYRS
jgi:hypothetical protein